MSGANRARHIVVLASLLFVAGCATNGTQASRENQLSSEKAAGKPVNAPALLSPRELAARARDAVVTITAYSQGKQLQSGTGFFIRTDGVLVTNMHVVTGADQLSIELSDGEIFDSVYVLSMDARRDLILLQVPMVRAPVLPVADERDVQIGDPVYAVGNPLGLRGTFSNGLVSGKRTEDGVTYIQITAPISEGSSGGPVMNQQGEVIGVATAFFADGQNLNMAIPARHASGLMALAATPTPFAAIAEEVKTEEARRIETRSDETHQLLELLPRETRASLQELDDYQQQTTIRALAVTHLAAGEGWIYVDGSSKAGVLEAGELDGAAITLERGRYLVAGVCDNDCTDLDLIVLDSSGEVVGKDTAIDAEPVVTFDVHNRQQFAIGTKMIQCATMNCVYSILVFRQ